MFSSLRNKRVLVTGGAGFIGSNLVEELLKYGAIVRVLDNFETGRKSNIEEFFGHPNFSMMKGDIRDAEVCKQAVKEMELISHQAALGSVPRSIEFPLNTHAVNATGFLNMLYAAKEAGIRRFVYASSSSVYGDSLVSPKKVGNEGNLLSPYAVTKQLNEQYAKVFSQLHGMETIGLRYFNVFGPKQDPSGVYAAAIPKFIDKMINGHELVINGDGEQTRDFTYVKNAVNANLLGLITTSEEVYGSVLNVACGNSYSLNNVLNVIQKSLADIGLYDDKTMITYGPKRVGDIQDSLADISLTERVLNYSDVIDFERGIKWYVSYISASLN